MMQQLRMNNVRCELYHETSKFDKQFKYAEKKIFLTRLSLAAKSYRKKLL